MKAKVERRRPKGVVDYVSLAVTTFGVGYLPLAPGTYGSLVGVGFYAALASAFAPYRYSAAPTSSEPVVAAIHAVILIAFLLFILLGIWAAGRSVELLGNTDAPEAVV
ncbi:MAG: phosphatidylglycerophosphatase A, partial [Acidobacteriota bacterium]